MGTELLPVGFRNFVALNRVIAILGVGSAPVQRLVREGREEGVVIDATAGRRTKAAIFMDDGSIVLTAITAETLSERAAANPMG